MKNKIKNFFCIFFAIFFNVQFVFSSVDSVCILCSPVVNISDDQNIKKYLGNFSDSTVNSLLKTLFNFNLNKKNIKPLLISKNCDDTNNSNRAIIVDSLKIEIKELKTKAWRQAQYYQRPSDNFVFVVLAGHNVDNTIKTFSSSVKIPAFYSVIGKKNNIEFDEKKLNKKYYSPLIKALNNVIISFLNYFYDENKK